MLKVRVFAAAFPNDLERKIAQWLAGLKDIRLMEVRLTSSYVGPEDGSELVCVLFYRVME